MAPLTKNPVKGYIGLYRPLTGTPGNPLVYRAFPARTPQKGVQKGVFLGWFWVVFGWFSDGPRMVLG
jgi:hypothetical protein